MMSIIDHHIVRKTEYEVAYHVSNDNYKAKAAKRGKQAR